MTEYEKCRLIRDWVATKSAEIIAYDWGETFSYKQLKELPDKIIDHEKLGKVDITKLTREEMENLGFKIWSKESNKMLIPLWLYPFLEDRITTESITGEQVLNKGDMDTDHRFGCLAYGIIPKDERNDE